MNLKRNRFNNNDLEHPEQLFRNLSWLFITPLALKQKPHTRMPWLPRISF